jgi:hypothetical protein
VARGSIEAEVLLCYDTTPWSISFESLGGAVWWSGESDQEGTKLLFRVSAPSGEETVVGRGSFNAAETNLNLQSWAFYRMGGRSTFMQYRIRGKFLDKITR